MTKDVEGVERVTEAARDLWGRLAFDEVGPQGFVLAVFGQAGFEEEAAEDDYVFWCAYSHDITIAHTSYGVKRDGRPPPLVVIIMPKNGHNVAYDLSAWPKCC